MPMRTMVASMDCPQVTKYKALVSAQPHRQEIIEDLSSTTSDERRGVALMSQRQPLTSGSQPGDSSLSQLAGPSQQTTMENDSKKPLTTQETAKLAAFSSKPLHGPTCVGLEIVFNNSHDNQNAAMLMHKTQAGKVLDHEGGFPNVMASASKTLQGGISNNVAEMGMLRNEASRDTGKLPVVQASPAGSSMPFKEHHLKLLRA
ncbi:hypothetical protein L2E82_46938 [Cichorium intybus]|uniref:Uncharacterized protein n=1 Tax=Cichorium intybus TaxID=13427 RepID=A0ACB8YV47_CICIN|nr:hypothetical protein L2E82_46938 [Cichorium intybus]